MIPLLVIRHAATGWNEAGRIQGRCDMPLSPQGCASAALWRLPAGWEDARRLTSPLRRARETAILLGLEAGLEVEPRLVEMDWGVWEGKRLADLRSELGPAMAASEALGLDFHPPGGESPRQVQQRLTPFLSELREQTIAVTHKGVLRALYALATGWTMLDKPADRLADGRAHLFGVRPGGAVVVEQLNIPLGGEA